ncbi:MAG: hypothetical protein ACRC7N_19175 [Clostridium sp.]
MGILLLLLIFTTFILLTFVKMHAFKNEEIKVSFLIYSKSPSINNFSLNKDSKF